MRNYEISPFSSALFKDFERDMDSLFPSSFRKEFDHPKMDILEKDGHLIASFDVPGVKKEDIKVVQSEGVISVHGERRNELQGDLYSEKFYGSFKRSFRIPKNYDAKKLEANYKDGVLSLALPLKEQIEPKEQEIEVKEHKQGIFEKLFS